MSSNNRGMNLKEGLLIFSHVKVSSEYRQNLIEIAQSNKCQPGYILSNCKQTTPKITTTLDSISTICQCTRGDSNSYNILFTPIGWINNF
jgi:hypothetical protein